MQDTPSGRFQAPSMIGQASDRLCEMELKQNAMLNSQTTNPNAMTFDAIKSPQPAAQPVAPAEIPTSAQLPLPGGLSNGPATPVGTDIKVSEASFGNTGTYDDSSPSMKTGWTNPIY